MSSSVTPVDQHLGIQASDDHHRFHKNPTHDVQEERIKINNKPKFSGKIMGFVFYFQLFVILLLAVLVLIRSFLSSHAKNHFQPSDWYPPVLSSVGLGGVAGLIWQTVTKYSPSKAIKLAFWFSPLLTCALGVVLVVVGSPAGLGFGVLSIFVSVVQSLYACWAGPRFDHAVSVLSVCAAAPPVKTVTVTVMCVAVSVVYSAALMCGVGGAIAIGTRFDKVFVVVILLSMAWSLQVVRNLLQVTVSRVRYLNFACGDETVGVMTSFSEAMGSMLGPICFGSVLVPTVSFIRGSARAVSLIAGDSDEFLFSCTDCYSGIAARLITCGNRWGFVHVGVYRKSIVQSSADTWEMFRRSGMEELIDCDLTSSFCFFCGVAGGAVSGLVGGCWALVVHKEYATQILVFGFLVGYFVSRVAMAWPQACVSAYHVAFAENPQSSRFDATIPFRLQELHRNRPLAESA